MSQCDVSENYFPSACGENLVLYIFPDTSNHVPSKFTIFNNRSSFKIFNKIYTIKQVKITSKENLPTFGLTFTQSKAHA